MQQCIVVSRPVRKADNYWEVVVRLIDSDYSSVLDFSGCQVGDTTRFQSNAMPEMHEEGYVKYQSNIENTETSLQLTDVMIAILHFMQLMKTYSSVLQKEKTLVA